MAKLLFSFLALFLTPDEVEKKEFAGYLEDKTQQAKEILSIQPVEKNDMPIESDNKKQIKIFF
ncbi:hypothetical protein [Marinigracilibium pacificum]|uniref:Uncharacterized protein n=1 Tax=Marinigracilibium pacificum TaxID=2729599 RepID=A0A848IW94_9BACT|nr:hypothetical protein [Marinigracilibium pacificum]NMM47956.1 hypothetical protein [Marinigracilibium pacificum]